MAILRAAEEDASRVIGRAFILPVAPAFREARLPYRHPSKGVRTRAVEQYSLESDGHSTPGL
ncbi:MAG: hypothetical protein JWO48_3085 [Bryobacterales bacterium]|nr:hypothetical protein [Bryobacterales bacterium]